MQIRLYGEKVMLRNLTQNDWPSFLQLHLDSAVQQYIREIEAENDIKAKFTQRLAPWFFDSGEWLSLVVERIDNQEIAGIIGFRCDDVNGPRAEVGYLMLPHQQGMEFATDSLRTIVDWGALQFNMHKFIGICACENLASLNVLKNVGFIIEGTLRQHSYINGTWFDDYYLGLLTSQRR